MSSSRTGGPQYLCCISGPDAGKRIALAEDAVAIGHSPTCEVPSDDDDVQDRHALVRADATGAVLEPVGGPIFVDGHQAGRVSVSPGQQVRIGRSLWRIERPLGARSGVLDRLGRQVSAVAGVETLNGFSARDMFSDVLTRHTPDEVETYFGVGTLATTPALSELPTTWPRPWAFARTLLFSLVIYFGFELAFETFANPNLIPGLIFAGSFAFPLVLVVFFFEMNAPRNVSLFQMVKLIFLGGFLAIVAALIGFRVAGGLTDWLGAMSAGIVEELAKVAALLLVVRRARYRWTLNGLLLGAAVGAGFAAFESAGYALRVGLASNSVEAMVANLQLRGLMTLFGGHTIWAALEGAALWRVRGDRPFSAEMLTDKRFLRVLGLSMAMHMLWDSPLDLPFMLKYVIIGFVGWVAVLSFVQEGLVQLRDAQRQAAVVTPAAAPPPPEVIAVVVARANGAEEGASSHPS